MLKKSIGRFTFALYGLAYFIPIVGIGFLAAFDGNIIYNSDLIIVSGLVKLFVGYGLTLTFLIPIVVELITLHAELNSSLFLIWLAMVFWVVSFMAFFVYLDSTSALLMLLSPVVIFVTSYFGYKKKD